MCGIYYGSIERAPEVLGNQEDRGLDGVGVISDTGIDKHFETGIALFGKLGKYQSFIENLGEKGNVIMHHRKASIGAVTEKNTHPFETDRFILCQNGTNKKVKTWGEVEGTAKETDSEILLEMVNNKCDSLSEAHKLLQDVSFNAGTIGTIFIIDKENDNVLYYSDGARLVYIEKTDTHIVEIRNYKDTKVLDEVKYKNKGGILFELSSGAIIDCTVKHINEETKKYDTVYSYAKTTYNNYSSVPQKAVERKKQLSVYDDALVKRVEDGDTLTTAEITYYNRYIGDYTKVATEIYMNELWDKVNWGVKLSEEEIIYYNAYMGDYEADAKYAISDKNATGQLSD